MAFDREGFIEAAKKEGYSEASINETLVSRGERPIGTFEKMLNMLPTAGGWGGAVAGSPVGLGPAMGTFGQMVGTGLRETGKRGQLVSKYGIEGAKEQAMSLKEMLPELLTKQAPAGFVKGALTQTGFDVVKGLASLFQLARLKPNINKLQSEKAQILQEQEPMPYPSIEQDVVENIPKELAGRGYSTRDIMSYIKNYLEGIKPLTRLTASQPSGETRDITYPNIQTVINRGYQDFGEQGLRKEVAQAGSKTLSDFYTKQIPRLAEVNAKLSELHGREPQLEAVKRTVPQTATRVGLAWLVYKLLGKLSSGLASGGEE